MKMFRNKKIGFRIMLAFVSVIFVFGVVGGIGILTINSISSNDTRLYEENTLGIEHVGEAAIYYQRIRFNALKMSVTEDTAEQKTYIEKANNYIVQTDDYLDQYADHIADDQGTVLYEELIDTWAHYKMLIDNAINDALSGDNDSAAAIVFGEAADTGASLQGQFEELFIYNAEMAQIKHTQNTQSAQTSTVSMIILVIAGVIIASFLGVVLTRSINKPLHLASEQLTKIATGKDLETLDTNQFSGEFIEMAQNLNNVKDSLNLLLSDTGSLVSAAISGDLSARADASKHLGGYKKVVEGVNNTLDAMLAPITEANTVLGEMQKGNLDINMTGDYKGDHANIKDTMNDTINTIKGYISEISSVLKEMSDGNLAVKITSDYRGDFIELKDSINTIIKSFNRVLSDINNAADQVAAGTRQVSAGSQAISQGATEQASSIEELTVSVTQIAAQTKQNAENANKANELSIATKSKAITGNAHMETMQSAMNEINESSENISKIIKVIDDIAFQTNILALNAAVEAARAGMHGKGFAVVAEEVRNLAARSANAVKETTTLIEGSIQKVEAGTDIANQTDKALKNIVDGVEKTVQLVSEIACASNEQSTAMSQVNNGIEQLAQVVQTNSATSEEAAAAAEELSSQADMLKGMASQFTLESGNTEKRQSSTQADPAIQCPDQPKKIVLNDNDFGKY